jgi:hypothetical protein
MRVPKAWNLAQRIVFVVAAALALSVLARWILYSEPSGGWFGYAPNTPEAFSAEFPTDGARFNDAMTVLISLGFIGAWVAFSLWVLRDERGEKQAD